MLPVVWQELINTAGLVHWQPREHILEVGVWVVPVHEVGGELDGHAVGNGMPVAVKQSGAS